MMFRVTLSAAVAALLCISALAQKPVPPPTPTTTPPVPAKGEPKETGLVPASVPGDTLHVQSRMASFKIVPRGTDFPTGRLEFSFDGTVMLNGLVPGSVLKTTGTVKEEYDNKEHGRQVFFGKGSMLVVGKFKGCQWFGRDLVLSFKGLGVVRVTAEFDKDLNTGSYWYDPAEKIPLQTSLMPLVVPQQISGPIRAIKREDFEKQKKQPKGG